MQCASGCHERQLHDRLHSYLVRHSLEVYPGEIE